MATHIARRKFLIALGAWPLAVPAHEAGITVTLPKPMTSGAKSEGRFGKQDFVHLADEDVYRCPAGEHLTYRYTNEEDGKMLRRSAMSGLPAQTAMHERSGATHHAMGARACARGRTAAPRR